MGKGLEIKYLFYSLVGILLIAIVCVIAFNKKDDTERTNTSYNEDYGMSNMIQEDDALCEMTATIEDGKIRVDNLTNVETRNTSNAKKIETKQTNNKNNYLEAFVSKAISQIGNGPDASGVTVYGKWYEENVDGSDRFASAAWCAMFLSWCANQAGVSKDTIGYFAECSYWKNEFYVKNNKWHDANGYMPARGDIIFFDNHNGDKVADHNGVVESVSGTSVIVIEGNLNNKVARATYALDDVKILGYGKPNYSKNVETKTSLGNGNAQKDTKTAKTATTLATGATASSSGADKIISIAESQLGNGLDGNGCTKYGYWYAENIDHNSYFASAPWCAMFVTWCANQAGISTDIITPYAYCGYGIQYFQEKGCYYTRSSGYVPKKGDVIFFGVDNHTGLVEYSQDGYVYTIEGNSTNSTVARRSYALTYDYINGYGSPKYN